MRQNNITLLTEDFLGVRNGFVTYRGSTHKLIPCHSKKMGRIYIAPNERTIILSSKTPSNTIMPKSILPFDLKIGLDENEWIKISRIMASSY